MIPSGLGGIISIPETVPVKSIPSIDTLGKKFSGAAGRPSFGGSSIVTGKHLFIIRTT